ncbi:hypothetical protein F7725_025930 [Dissostichus mawsoni]|uniref:ZP domain-containing protein n=1 Tax=Dissostichus mawsoni TaxID=36200 RepID=A0A7J5X5N5_DISMA|nr:hypothetical protein F7725_025930 [Dissostichus mawsoni]
MVVASSYYYHTNPTSDISLTPTHTTKPRLHTSPTTKDNRPMHGTTPPLSKLPLQFSFLVDPPAPSCVDGLYLPTFVHPTPENGQHINAEVNKEVEIRVRAQASHATLHDIIISGPLNIRKHRSTHGDFVIRWTPGPDDVGDHYPICFAVESVIESGIYQSEMRCVLVNIGQILIESHVTCDESSMTVEVNRSSLPGLHEDHLRLNDPSNTACNLQTNSNSTHIIAIVPLNACGTQIEVQFYCQYPKRGNVSQGFTAHRRNVVVWDKGFGKFTYEFEFYPDSQYRKMVDPGLYPLEYDGTERIYMQIEAKSTVNNTQLFVESCSAAPYDTPNYWPTYSIIENGCTVDQTVQVHPKANPREFRFSMEAFHCSVLMCEAGSSGTRCSQGCINSPLTGHHNHRKREAITQSARHFISQGPLPIGMISAVALYKVDFRNKATYDGCQYSHYLSCSAGNCGYVTNQQRGTIDRSTNAPQSNRQWCETETVQQRKVPTDKPFQMRVPQNCPRTYKLMSFDPDGDTVRCRYGNIRNIECSGCNQPSGFVLDQWTHLLPHVLMDSTCQSLCTQPLKMDNTSMPRSTKKWRSESEHKLHMQLESHVTCDESSMTVEVKRSSLPGLHEDHLRLNDPSNTACNLQTNSNSTHIIAVVPLNACGTQIEFSYEFEFYPDIQYRQMIDPGLYPLEYDVKNRIYMQIEAKSTVNNTELFVESCSAAPYDTPNYWPTYSIIENGCNLDQTVYISCSVLMCEAGSSGTRCSQGCINSPLTGHHHHHKREAITQSARHFISQGPLRTPLNLNLVFIAGCLLAAVGMISAVALYKVRASKVKYQPLPSFEN